MDSHLKASRKVRFTLPEHETDIVAFIKSRNSPGVYRPEKPSLVKAPESVDDSKVHGTLHYVNGTLNFVQDEFKPFLKEGKSEKNVVEPKYLRPCIKSPRKSRDAKRSTLENETTSQSKASPLPTSITKKFHYLIRSRSESRGRKKEILERNQKCSFGSSLDAFYFPDTMKSMPSKTPRTTAFITKPPDILTAPASNTNTTSLIERNRIRDTRSAQVLPNFATMNLNDNSPVCVEEIPRISTKIQNLPHMQQMVNNDTNYQNFTQFVDRWQFLHGTVAHLNLSSLLLKEPKMNCDTSTKIVRKKTREYKTFSVLSSNYRKRIMNIEKTPLVTSLIRACKNADLDELIKVKESICRNGITPKDLNSVDNNGRTALSYICITSYTKVLDFLLQLRGIDVNKADNEGNTPLHFAAEAGQAEIITMLITRSRSLIIDAKNNFGLTPLMKAAIQGRTECAKGLILANACPLERDPFRRLTTEQWAQLCGHKDCADLINKLIRSRIQATLLRKDFAGKMKREGIMTKLMNIIPNMKRPKLSSETDLPDLLNTMTLKESVLSSLPIVEITPANNLHLISKYKNRYATDELVNLNEDLQAIMPTKVSLRRNSCNQ
ncbi:Ankyrin repeat domain-containing protein 33B [Pseudolycoriella hygida]|uniref:Ankyrin repeat domain-containing protein 33B n=1 Tax=Pseudolycoriella hygida TaxID=35572 RepID=A0A9Q0MZP8_9DIPT|nr:Ankyrin repeat domain-containing protein 33B [Pseudolycoriella hygida]